jgi:hypothetical protein
MPTRSEAIARFLNHAAPPDLAALYNINMECQVNVAQDGGMRTDGEFKGRKWHGWTDGNTTWKSFRIPFNAKSEASYTDSEIKFELDKHAEGIGMTGWDWQAKVSRWVAFDFDAIVGHSEKHEVKFTAEQLDEVKHAASEIPWVTVRRSAGGKGLHLYVFLDPLIPTSNHTEHAALARSILGMMSALTGFDFKSKVDICGGNMWVWHRKAKGNGGLELLKQGIPLADVPANWRDHVVVISNKRRRNLPQFVEQNPKGEDVFEELCGQNTRVPLDEEHKRLLAYLQDNGAMWWWDQDRHMLVCHTADLAAAHTALNYRGIYTTASMGKEKGVDQNCFAFPMRRGAWVLRRHTPGVNEAKTWDQDGSGWTRCYYNREPDLRTASRSFGGIEDPKTGGFVFPDADNAIKAAGALGATISVPERLRTGRETTLRTHKDGRLICEIQHSDTDKREQMDDWLPRKGVWAKIHTVKLSAPNEPDTGNYDDIVRHLVTESGDNYGWLMSLWRTLSWLLNPPVYPLRK